MVSTAIELDPRLIAFVFPSIPESVRMARFHVRAALGFHELGKYADDAEAITSELVTNVIRHVCSDGSETVGVILARTWNPESVTVVVTDSSPEGPVMLRHRPGVSGAGGSRSWTRCRLTGAGTRKTAGKRSSRYSRRRRARDAGDGVAA